jgi:hypothetical protein
MSTNDKLREEFEAWDRAEFDYSPSDYVRSGVNVYEDAVIQQCWMAYRAASYKQEERVKKLREALLSRLDSMLFHPSASHVHPEYRDGYNYALRCVVDLITTEAVLKETE